MSMNEHHTRDFASPRSPAFDVDGNLGVLAKWLRILGFDAAFPRKSASRGRVFVTMNRFHDSPLTVVVEDADPIGQLKQVIADTGIIIREELFFTRCLLCNVPVREISPARAGGKAPEAILQTRRVFHECPLCHRVYWEGSHETRIKRRLANAEIPMVRRDPTARCSEQEDCRDQEWE